MVHQLHSITAQQCFSKKSIKYCHSIIPGIITQEEEGDERANNGGEKEEGICMHASMQ